MRRLRQLLFLLGLGCVALGGVGVLVHYVGPESNTLIILSSFVPVLVAVGVVGLIALVVCRAWRTAVIGLVVVLAGFVTQAPLFLANRPDMGSAVPGPELRVLQANIRLGEADTASLIELIRSNSVDIVTVEELTYDAVSRLAAAGIDQLLPEQYLAPKPSGGGGTGIYSRFALSDKHPLGYFAMANLSAKVELGDGRAVSIAAVHPMAPYPSPAWMWASEMSRLREALRERAADGDPMIVSGDFNSTYSHSRYRDILSDGFADAADQVGAGLTATYPADRGFPAVIGIDHILTQRAVVEEFHEVDLPGSDHHGLFAVVTTYWSAASER